LHVWSKTDCHSSLDHRLASPPLCTSPVLVVERHLVQRGGVHLLVLDAQWIELHLLHLLTILCGQGFCKSSFELRLHVRLFLSLPCLSLLMHLLLVLGFQLTEFGAFTLIECRGLSLCGRTILQRLEVTLSLAHRLRLSLEARLIALHFDIEQLLLR